MEKKGKPIKNVNGIDAIDIKKIRSLVHRLHEAGYCHLDLKNPGNILYDGKRFYIIDFGLARPCQTGVPGEELNNRNRNNYQLNDLLGAWKESRMEAAAEARFKAMHASSPPLSPLKRKPNRAPFNNNNVPKKLMWNSNGNRTPVSSPRMSPPRNNGNRTPVSSPRRNLSPRRNNRTPNGSPARVYLPPAPTKARGARRISNWNRD